jgi:methyl-accepting chemotaxis protein
MGAITGATLQEQIQKAITAHGVFKVRLSMIVEAGTTEMTAATAAADSRCPVGQWLYGGLDPSVKASAHYQTVMDLHATFHRAAGDVMALSLARKQGEALAAMETPSTFKQASDKLVAALTAWSDSLV